MKCPIIVIADHIDVSFYNSPEIAAFHLEAIDVLNGIYEVYDANACLLDIKIYPVKIEKKWFEFYKPKYVDILKMECNQTKMINYDKVIKILKDFYRTISIDVQDNMTLSDLINIAKKTNLIETK